MNAFAPQTLEQATFQLDVAAELLYHFGAGHRPAEQSAIWTAFASRTEDDPFFRLRASVRIVLCLDEGDCIHRTLLDDFVLSVKARH